MARTTIIFGLLLCAATLLILLNLTTQKITSAFIPIVFGIPIFICGIISLNPHRARFWLRVAVIIACVGAIGSLFRMGDFMDDWADGEKLYPIPVSITSGLLVALSSFSVALTLSLRK